jgi:hypothetical protein
MTNAWVINPTLKTIEPVDCQLGDIHDMYRLIECDCFDAVRVQIASLDCTAWVDDEGALKEPEDQHCCFFAGAHLAGNILLTGGADIEGNTLPCPSAITKEMLEQVTEWTDEPVVPFFHVTPF